MKILIVSLNFAPELTGIGKYSGEMASWLAAKDHKLRVVSAPPYYPEWRVSAGYSGKRYCKQLWSFDNGAQAVIWRTPVWVPNVLSGVTRLLHLSSFALSSLPIMLLQIRWRPDVIIVVEPTLACVPATLLVSKMSGARAWLHIQDYEVDAAFQMGMLKSSLVRRFALFCERLLMRGFDRISTISPRMLERLQTKSVPVERRVLFPNWVDIQSVFPLLHPSSFRSELSIAENTVVALYSGNLGEKQGLDILIEAASETRYNTGLVWVIAGAGSARERLEAMSSNLPNVKWLPLQPLERLNELLNLADIHLLPQRADAADLVMPSKLTGMLASGRPMVATAAADTQVATVVETCGIVVEPGNTQAFTDAVMKLLTDAKLRSELGCNARDYAEKCLSYDSIMGSFEQELVTVVDSARSQTVQGKS